MNEGYLILCLLLSAAVLLCLLFTWLQYRRTRKTMKALMAMLESAIDNSFTEHDFDESLLSAVESRMNQYLSASLVSARNLQAEKEKIKELLADISHQTKTPLSNIVLYAQLLQEQELSREGQDCVAALNGQAEKISFLITSLVKLSRLETGVITLCPLAHAVAPMLAEVTGQFAPKAMQKEICLLTDTTDAHAVFDDKWTTEALCNLVDNAVKYTPLGGTIRLSVKSYDLFCRIDVADSGIGIAEAEQAKIFTRFYRSQAVSEQEGVGIGLYLTRQILAGQGGYLKVASTLGNGAVFSIFLPREA